MTEMGSPHRLTDVGCAVLNCCEPGESLQRGCNGCLLHKRMRNRTEATRRVWPREPWNFSMTVDLVSYSPCGDCIQDRGGGRIQRRRAWPINWLQTRGGFQFDDGNRALKAGKSGRRQHREPDQSEGRREALGAGGAGSDAGNSITRGAGALARERSLARITWGQPPPAVRPSAVRQ